MKFIYLSVLSLFLLTSCGGDKKAEAKEEKVVKTEEVKTVEKKVDSKVSPELAGIKEKGKAVYGKTCMACHQANGKGLKGAFPPLAKSDYLLADRKRAIKQVLKGSTGEIVVNGEKFNGTMPAQVLNNAEVANVLTFVMNSWGNDKGIVTEAEVAEVKKTLK